MKIVKSINIGNITYSFGCVTNYERTEQEKEHRRYFIKQKTIGMITIILAALSLLIDTVVPEFGIFTIIMAFMGIALILTNKHAICI